jgi:tRNA-dihydrouridine synthase B
MMAHMDQLYAFYGERDGVRVARKHLGWYRDTAINAHQSTGTTCAQTSAEALLFREMRVAESTSLQLAFVRAWFDAVSAEAATDGSQQDPEPRERTKVRDLSQQRAGAA